MFNDMRVVFLTDSKNTSSYEMTS